MLVGQERDVAAMAVRYDYMPCVPILLPELADMRGKFVTCFDPCPVRVATAPFENVEDDISDLGVQGLRKMAA